jgi:PhoPQ-activated pathogenicity-related protein
MPKYVVQGVGDQYFCPDSSQFYYGDLPEEKLLRYIPNTDHSLKGSDVRDSVVAYFWTVVNGVPRPKYAWAFEDDGSIDVRTSDRPKKVLFWQATNAKARDFRLEIIGPAFRSEVLKDLGGGHYVGKIEAPKQGWTASLVELTYDVGGLLPLKVTTAVRITPDTLPHKDVDPTKAPYESKPVAKSSRRAR